MEVLVHLKYERMHQIGVGAGMNSKVYRGRDPQRGGGFAFKEIPKQLLRDQGIYDYFQEAKAMFSSEHPENVVPVNFAGENEQGTHICIAMPYYANGSLADRISHDPLPVVETIRVGIGILSGLQRIHNAGFVHFDLKPSNILFSNRNDPMVADFGQTRAIDPSTGSVPIPWMYLQGIPPECFGSDGTVRSDIFQAGATLYRAVNGEPIFAQQKQTAPDAVTLRSLVESAVKSGKLPNRDIFLPHVPRALRTVIRKAVTVNPTDRYRSASDFMRDLGRISVVYDWSVKNNPGDEIVWTGSRVGFAPIEVTLIRDKASKWKVEVHTCSGCIKRKRGLSNGLWKDNMTRDESLTHLRRVVFPAFA